MKRQPFSPVFPLAESITEAFFLAIPLEFQGKKHQPFSRTQPLEFEGRDGQLLAVAEP